MYFDNRKTNIEGVTAHITYAYQPDGTYVMRATALVNGTPAWADKIKEVKRKVHGKYELETVADKVTTAIERQVLRAKKRMAALSQTNSQATTAVGNKRLIETAFDSLLASLHDPSYNSDLPWDGVTLENKVNRFGKRVLLLLSQYEDDELAYVNLDQLFLDLTAQVAQNGHSGDRPSAHARTARGYMFEASYIYQELQKLKPELPDIHISEYLRSHSGFKRLPQPEQVRYFPAHVDKAIAAELEALATIEPKYVFSTVLSYDAGLRTGESAAGHPSDILDLGDDCSAYLVRFQEDHGKRSPKLKTESGYRNPPLSFWGRTLLDRCIAAMGNDVPAPDIAMVPQDKLSIWQKALLDRVGLDEKFWAAVRRDMDINPDIDENGIINHSVTSYAFRRNAATRMYGEEAMQKYEITSSMGHANHIPKRTMEDLRLPEHLKKLAIKRERHIFNPLISRHPAISPIALVPERDINVIPFSKSTFVNNGNLPISISINVCAVEPGEEIRITVPTNSANDPLVCSQHIFHPNARTIIHPTVEGDYHAPNQQ